MNTEFTPIVVPSETAGSESVADAPAGDAGGGGGGGRKWVILIGIGVVVVVVVAVLLWWFKPASAPVIGAGAATSASPAPERPPAGAPVTPKLTNGSFTADAMPAGKTYDYRPIAGWTSGQTILIASGDEAWGAVVHPSGRNTVGLQGGGGTGFLAQPLAPVTPGANYRVSLLACGRPHYGTEASPQRLAVTVNDAPVLLRPSGAAASTPPINPTVFPPSAAPGVLKAFEGVFAAPTDAPVLKIVNVSDPGDLTVIVADVNVQTA